MLSGDAKDLGSGQLWRHTAESTTDCFDQQPGPALGAAQASFRGLRQAFSAPDNATRYAYERTIEPARVDGCEQRKATVAQDDGARTKAEGTNPASSVAVGPATNSVGVDAGAPVTSAVSAAALAQLLKAPTPELQLARPCEAAQSSCPGTDLVFTSRKRYRKMRSSTNGLNPKVDVTKAAVGDYE